MVRIILLKAALKTNKYYQAAQTWPDILNTAKLICITLIAAWYLNITHLQFLSWPIGQILEAANTEDLLIATNFIDSPFSPGGFSIARKKTLGPLLHACTFSQLIWTSYKLTTSLSPFSFSNLKARTASFYEAILPFISWLQVMHTMCGLIEQLKLCTLQPADSAGTCFSHSTWNILRKTSSISLYKCEESCWCLLHPCKYQQRVHTDTAKRQNVHVRSFPRSPLHSKPCFSSFVVRSSTGVNPAIWGFAKEKATTKQRTTCGFRHT